MLHFDTFIPGYVSFVIVKNFLFCPEFIFFVFLNVFTDGADVQNEYSMEKLQNVSLHF